jgi:23S rRNA pseudouridine1911/1915/1917 synthase
LVFTVEVGSDNTRLDVVLSGVGGVTRSAAALCIDNGACAVNGAVVGKSHKVKVGDVVEYSLAAPLQSDLVAQDIPLDIVYEDEYLIVVNKPKGMVVHPASGNPNGTLLNALLAHTSLSNVNEGRPGIVHRIDKDTSGLLLVAKTDTAHNSLAEQIAAHTCGRVYEGVVCGNIRESGTISVPLGRCIRDRKKRAAYPIPRTNIITKHAVTHYAPIAEYNGFTHTRFVLETGRTHQIRVHAAYIRRPILGDTVYGGRELNGLHGQCLHAKRIEFTHPVTGARMEFDSELPDYFTDVIRRIELF